MADAFIQRLTTVEHVVPQGIKPYTLPLLPRQASLPLHYGTDHVPCAEITCRVPRR